MTIADLENVLAFTHYLPWIFFALAPIFLVFGPDIGLTKRRKRGRK